MRFRALSRQTLVTIACSHTNALAKYPKTRIISLFKTVVAHASHYGFEKGNYHDAAEALAVLYLILPAFIFFGSFIRLRLALPACVLLLYIGYKAIRHARWHGVLDNWPLTLYFFAISALWLWLGGAGGTFFQGGDWLKHYGILNLLVDNSWPPLIRTAGQPVEAMRYYVGWYLVPAVLLKVTSLHAQNIMLALWSFTGVTIFFQLLPRIFKSRRAAVIAPLVFILFSGADIIGTAITNVHVGPIFHIEWWSSWIQYASNTTSMYWVPQHALPSWIMIALFLRQMKQRSVLPVLGATAVATLIWSPFSTLGLIPFYSVMMIRYGYRELIFNWRSWAAVIFVGLPILIYLTAGTSGVPHAFIWNLPCGLDNGYCFNARTYWLFLAIEVLAPLAVLICAKVTRSEFLLVAGICLFLLPLVHIGVGNDLTTRGSLAALAVLAILSTEALVERSAAVAVAMAIVLLAGIATPGGEMLRAFFEAPIVSQDTKLEDVWAGRPVLRDQYIAPLPISVLRVPGRAKH